MNRIIDSNGYVYIHMPNHHRAKANGLVAEHIVVAEKMLGRKLEDLEEVHHEDRDKTNNTTENLYVFATKEDHVRYHHNGLMIKVDDYYTSPSVAHKISTCEICGDEFEYLTKSQTGKYCSHKCYHKAIRKAERPSKEELINLIKTKSFLQIGKDYNVSDNAIRKWCKSYGLPFRKNDIKNLFNR